MNKINSKLWDIYLTSYIFPILIGTTEEFERSTGNTYFHDHQFKNQVRNKRTQTLT